MGHKSPDADSIGSSLALARLINKATGKKVDVFVNHPIPKNLRFLDKDKEIKILNKLAPESGNEEEFINNIKAEYGEYNLAFLLDTAQKRSVTPPILEAIYKPAQNKVLIDHHEIYKGKDIYKFANEIKLIDDTKESTAQLIMQFAHGFGFSVKNIKPEISDSILAGIITDAKQFALAKGSAIFSDIAELAKTSNVAKMIEKLNNFPTEKIRLATTMLNNDLRLVNKGKTAYIMIDGGTNPNATKEVRTLLFEQMRKMDEVENYFIIVHDSLHKDWKNTALIRSKNKPIQNLLKNINDGSSHSHSRSFSTDLSTEELEKLVVSELANL